MNFDTLNVADCIIPAGGGNGTQPPPDPRCSDAGFAAANPSICGSAEYLIIKPGVAILCALGSIQFSVFLYQNGTETEVTDGLTFTSSDEDVLAIGVHTGSATGLVEGEVNVTAERNGLTTTAALTVLSNVDCCDSIQVKTSILIDDSKSMGLAFGGGYQSRLSFAKEVASDYADKIIEVASVPKDSIKVWKFSDSATQISSGFLTDTIELASEINGVTQTQLKTDLGTVLLDAANDLIAATATEKVILLISDGENTVGTDVQPILDTATMFKAAGGIIICIGLRASGTGYDLLSRIATGGFFLNATSNNMQVVLDGLNYLKSILCAGNCITLAGTVYSPALDYSSFINWEVIAGQVNLIGNGFLDLQPGNGLYVDMMGGTAGTIRSIDTFSLVAGRTYRISFKAAGNNRLDSPGANQKVLVSILNADPAVPINLATIFSHVVSPAWDDPFTPYAFSFTAAFDVDVKVLFQQLYEVSFTGDWHGNLLGGIKFEEVSTLTTLLEDDFDSENPVSQPGSPYGSYCASEVPGLQLQDANPLPDVENGSTPGTYTVSKTVCVGCPTGQANIGFYSGMTSLIPPMTSNTTPSGIALGSGWNPDNVYVAFNGSGTDYWDVNERGSPSPVMPAWLQYKFAAATVIDQYAFYQGGLYSFPRDWTFLGSNDGTTWAVLDTRAGYSGTSNVDNVFSFTNTTAYLYYRINITSANGFDAGTTSLFCSIGGIKMSRRNLAPTQICKTADGTGSTQAIANKNANDAATALAQAELNCVPLFTSTLSYKATCAADYSLGSIGSDVTKTAVGTSINSQQEADDNAYAAARALAIADLVCNTSNYTQKITINDDSVATPYPSVKNVSGSTGLISKVVVSLKGIYHESAEDVNVFLMSPSGTIIRLMQKCGGTNYIGSKNFGGVWTGIDISFDDSVANFLPTTTIAAGTYKPTGYGLSPIYPTPFPAGIINTELAFLTGENPNGNWALFVFDQGPGDVGAVSAGWDLVITTAPTTVLYALGDLHTELDVGTINHDLSALVPLPKNGLFGMLVLGDVGKASGTPLLSWQDYYAMGWENLLTRTLFTPGNHDWLVESLAQENNTKSFWAGSLSAVYGSNFPGSITTDPVGFNYSKRFGNWKIICFNSEAYEDIAGTLNVGGAVYNWLVSELADANTHFIVVSHRGRWANDTTHGDMADLDDVWRLFVQRGVTAWVCGHSHVSEVGANRDAGGNVVATGGTVIVRNGTGNPALYAFNNGYTPAGAFIWQQNALNVLTRLTLTGTALTVEFLNTAGANLPNSTFVIPAL